MPVPTDRQFFGAPWNHSPSSAFRAKRGALLCHCSGKDGSLGPGSGLSQTALSNSEPFIHLTAPKCLWFLKNYHLCTTCQPCHSLCLESSPPPSEEAGLREGAHSDHQQVRAPCSPAPLCSGPVPGHQPVAAASPASPGRGRLALLQALGTLLWINYPRLHSGPATTAAATAVRMK